MASLIKGITVTLFEKIKTGENDFGAAIYKETPVTVENVLVSPVSSGEMTTDEQLDGNLEICELSIPKKNTNAWENSIVEFRDQKWKTFGFVQQYITENVPLDWDKKVRAKRYG
jgi:hypothetical protein